jgi:phosphatidylglycerophosphate synthase
MLAKAAIIVFLLVIVYALVSAFYFLIRDKGQGRRTVRRLTWRIGLAMLLFLVLYGAFLLGWLHPSGPNPVNYPSPAAQPEPNP